MELTNTMDDNLILAANQKEKIEFGSINNTNTNI